MPAKTSRRPSSSASSKSVSSPTLPTSYSARPSWKTPSAIPSAAKSESPSSSPSARKFRIPLPPLATQQAIVAEIEAEQALVAANGELISRFEQKIHATLARVCGGETPAAPET